MNKKIIIFMIVIINSVRGFCISINGYSFLENQLKHSGIQVLFERVAPSYLSFTTSTDTNGYYLVEIEEGIYDITFSKLGYISATLSGQVLYSNYSIPDTTIEQIGLSGNLYDTITAGIYKIGGNITVQSGSTLKIDPGVIFLFKQNITFTINGLLIAEGTQSDSIIFTNYEPGLKWGGILFNDSANDYSLMSYCIVENSYINGIKVNSSNPKLNRITVRNVTGYQYSFTNQGGIHIENSNSSVSNCVLKGNFANGVSFVNSISVLSNTIALNNGFSGLMVFGSTSKVQVVNSLLKNNESGIFWENNYPCFADLSISNCIVVENNKFGVVCTTSTTTTPIIKYSDIWNNATNFENCGQWFGVIVTTNVNGDSCDAYVNISTNPLFENSSTDNYHLQSGSPCIDAGINNSVSEQFDFENNKRILDGNNDGTEIVDLGIFEYGNQVGFKENLKLFANGYIYPNPCLNYFYLEIEEDYLELRVLNHLGQRVLIKYYNAYKNYFDIVDIDNLAKGFYYVQILKRNGTSLNKLIVK